MVQIAPWWSESIKVAGKRGWRKLVQNEAKLGCRDLTKRSQMDRLTVTRKNEAIIIRNTNPSRARVWERNQTWPASQITKRAFILVRFLVVITILRETRIRVVTAFPAPKDLIDLYFIHKGA